MAQLCMKQLLMVQASKILLLSSACTAFSDADASVTVHVMKAMQRS